MRPTHGTHKIDALCGSVYCEQVGPYYSGRVRKKERKTERNQREREKKRRTDREREEVIRKKESCCTSERERQQTSEG